MHHSTEPLAEELERFRPYLMLLARKRLGLHLRHKVGISDVVQLTLLEACRSPQKVKGRSEAERAAWLRTALAHHILHAARDLKREKRNLHRERSLEQALDVASVHLGNFLVDGKSSPSQRAARNERALLVSRALQSLPDAQREAVTQHYWEGRTLPEIARQLGRSRAAVAGLLVRGLKVLSQLLPNEV
jgi:RNA polymerase sigma-70 factor (ECF subfamily)